MKKKVISTVFAICISFCFWQITAAAAPVIITGYDIQDAVKSGFGGWAHYYNGTITDKGSVTAHGFTGTVADYASGKGTLNDGIVGTDKNNTQLFATDISPVITLYLDNTYLIENITLFSFVGTNSVPGNITGLDITVGGTTQTFATTDAVHIQHEFADLIGSTISGILTDSIILSSFTTDPGSGWEGGFSISEISLNGTPVPVPAAFWLFGSGLLGLFGVKKRNLHSRPKKK